MSAPELDFFLRDTEFPSMARRAEPLLLVDDSASVRKIVIALLRKLGIKDVDEASGAREAFRKMHERSYRVVICDVVMGEVSGIQLIKACRENPQTLYIPVLMMTGSMDPRFVAQSKGQAEGYILKPFSVEGLQRALNEILPTAVADAVGDEKVAADKGRVDRYAHRG